MTHVQTATSGFRPGGGTRRVHVAIGQHVTVRCGAQPVRFGQRRAELGTERQRRAEHGAVRFLTRLARQRTTPVASATGVFFCVVVFAKGRCSRELGCGAAWFAWAPEQRRIRWRSPSPRRRPFPPKGPRSPARNPQIPRRWSRRYRPDGGGPARVQRGGKALQRHNTAVETRLSARTPVDDGPVALGPPAAVRPPGGPSRRSRAGTSGARPGACSSRRERRASRRAVL